MKTTLAALAILLATPVLAEAPKLDGTWSSVGAENIGQMYATRDFTFDGDAWSIKFRAFWG